MPDAMNPQSLEEKLYAFIATLDGAEIIDSIELTPPQRDAEKADLLLTNRTIIGEVKSLSKDTSVKIDSIVEPYRETEDWPLFYMSWPIADILACLPNGEILKRQVYEAVTSAIPELVRKANRQIRSTKQTFGIPEARGLLVVLNDFVGILDPRVVAHAVAVTLSKRNPDGSLQFPEIMGVWIISESHVVQLGRTRATPAVIMEHPALAEPSVVEYLSQIQPLWAAFNGLPLVEVPPEAFDGLEFKAGRLTDDADAGPITLSEHWRREYGKRPYLRSLSEEQLLEYGAKLAAESGNQFLVGSLSRHHERLRGPCRFGDLIEELNFRKIDLRRLKPYNETARIYLPARIPMEEYAEE